jgi:hypothetical protein
VPLARRPAGADNGLAIRLLAHISSLPPRAARLLTPALVAGLAALCAVGAAAAPEPVDSEPHLLVVHHTSDGREALAASGARTVARYEAFTLVEAAGADAARLLAAGADLRDDMREVRLGARDVDPARERRSLVAGAVAGGGSGTALVQFVGPVKDPWLERVEATGVEPVTYMAQNAYLVHGSAAELAALARAAGDDPAIRALVAYEAQDKLARGVAAKQGGATFEVQTIAGESGEPARRALGRSGRELRPTARGGRLRTQFVAADAAAVRDLARDPAVVSVLPYVEPKLLDERAAQIVAGNLTASHQPTGPGYLAWLAGEGFGSGTFDFAIDVTDEGVDTATLPGAHPDFYAGGSTANPTRIAYKRNWTTDLDARDCGGHGTNVASIAAGFNDAAGTDNDTNDAGGFNYGLGIAPRARVGASKIFTCAGSFSLVGSFDDLTTNAYAQGARVSNNSWGADVAGAYNADSQDYDRLVRDAQPGVDGNQQLVEVFANGNAGPSPGTVGSPATAKNVISVGASENVRAIGFTDGCGVTDGGANSARDIIDFSSRGPTVDGRTKPDVVAPGTHVTGAQPQTGADYNGTGTCTPQFPSGSALYSLVSGTSQATPEASGFAALIRDDYRRTVGNGTPPSPAMTKALMVNTAVDLAGGDAGNGAAVSPVPNRDQGWGRISARNAFDSTTRHHVDQTVVLGASGEQHVVSMEVVDPSRPVRVTLAWTDAPGPTSGNAFVNDLDLRVTQGTATFRGNVMSGGTSVAGGAPDTRNNLENVFLAAGASGRLTLAVTATSISGNGLPGNADGTDQDFALVVSNARPRTNQAPTAAMTATPASLAPGESATFDASGSRDPDGRVASYAWDLDGDGSFETSTGATPTATRSYASAGSFTVRVRVTDDEGGNAEASVPVTVVAPPDVTAPRLAVSLFTTARARELLRRRFRVNVECDEACTVSLRLSLPVRRAGSRRARDTVVAIGSARLAAGRDAEPRLRPTRAGRRVLPAIRRTRGRLLVQARDAAGNVRTVRRTITVRR